MPAEPRPLVATESESASNLPAPYARRGVVRLAGVEEPALVREDARRTRTDRSRRTRRRRRRRRRGVGAPLRRLRLRPPPRSRPVGTPIGTPVVKVVVVHRTRTLAPAVDAAVAVFVARRRPRPIGSPGAASEG